MTSSVCTRPAPQLQPVRVAASMPAPIPQGFYRRPGLGPIRDGCTLNRSDIEELRDNQESLDLHTQQFLDLVYQKPEIYPDRFFEPHYLGNSALLIASSYPGSKRYAHCGVPNLVNRAGNCRDHKFCPYCNFLVRRQALQTYVPAFDHGTWHFLTLSFHGQLGFNHATAYASLDCWDACRDALQHLLDLHRVRGLHWTEELAIRSFLPLRVLPHVHAVVDADTFGEEDLAQLQQRMLAWRSHEGEALPREPDLDVRPIRTERSLFDRIRYLYKPLDLVPKYESAWPLASQNDRARAWELNSQVRELAAGIFQIRKDRQRMNSKGSLNPKDKRFIGIKKDERAGYADHLRQLQAQEPEYPDEPTQ